eukprot:TRINITY_DN7790_c0_g1_i1.p2 TRINITY_DN7790_c0_g1~~TRINITY_DN7790_c0_g1_i1.p2  ORF type:complete len:332 (+),score=181.83 TRINITY_DN7790_c0_g1_i1:64-1059(+)
MRSMRTGVRQLQRQGKRFSSSQASSDGGSGMLLFGFGLVGGAGLYHLFGSKGAKGNGGMYQGGNDKATIEKLQKRLKELEGQAKSSDEATKSKADEGLKLLSDDFLQCTKGSEQLTGEMEHMALRLKATQEELQTSRRRMDDLTKDNDEYLSNLTSRIQAGKATSSAVGYVTADGDLVAFRRTAGSKIAVFVAGEEKGVLSDNVAYDEKAGVLSLSNTDEKLTLPADRRDQLVGQIATLADTVGIQHALVENVVQFTDTDGDVVKFVRRGGKMLCDVGGSEVITSAPVAYDAASGRLELGGAGSCTVPEAQKAVLQRLKRMAEGTSTPHNL